jgi:hypothetical protein
VNKQLAKENRSLVNYVQEEIRLMHKDRKNGDLSNMQLELDDALCDNAYLRAKLVSMQDEETSKITESNRNDNIRSCTTARSEKQWIPIECVSFLVQLFDENTTCHQRKYDFNKPQNRQ